MATRMNRYYNDPMIGQAMSNLSGIFAPPSGRDAAGWAAANAANAENQRLSQLFDYAQRPDYDQAQFDRLGLAGGLWNPSQSFYSVDQGNMVDMRGQDLGRQTALDTNFLDNQTAMRGQDIGQSTALATNMRDNQRSIAQTLLSPVGTGQVRPGLTGGLAEMFGMPEQPDFQGREAMPSLSEAQGAAFGTLSPEEQRLGVMGDIPVERIVGPEGTPQFSYRPDAVGAEAYVDRGSQASLNLRNYMTEDGMEGSALFDPMSGQLTDASTGEALPQGTRTYTGQLTGGGAETGFGATARNISENNNRYQALARARNIGQELETLLQSNPGASGIVGGLRRFSQNLGQTIGEAGQYMTDQGLDVDRAVTDGVMDSGLATEFFNPELPEIDSAMNELIWAYATAQQSGGRVSNEQMRAVREAFGFSGALSNNAQRMAAINRMVRSAGREMETLAPAVDPRYVEMYGAQQPSVGGQMQGGALADGPRPGEVQDGYRFVGGDPADPNSWEPAQ